MFLMAQWGKQRHGVRIKDVLFFYEIDFSELYALLT